MLKKLFSFLKKKDSCINSIPKTESLRLIELGSYRDLLAYFQKNKHEIEEISRFEKSLIPPQEKKFFYPGFCYICKREVKFLVDFQYALQVEGKLYPNWRERLVCPRCQLNNRMRAAIHIFMERCRPKPEDLIYLTEQTTPVYKWFKENFSHVWGSEYLGERLPYGSHNKQGIRNEDLTALTFQNDAFDFILSFDVFEHIPDYLRAFQECYRCLKPGGTLYFSVPFMLDSPTNLVRAIIDETGKVKHLLPPEYHGDPVNPEGCLCFYHFGWELLEQLRNLGFEEVKALLYWSKYFAYLGGYQPLFIAHKKTT